MSHHTSSFPLSSVRLLDSGFKHAQDVDLRYLLSLDTDRLLAPFRREAGLPTAAPGYGGWEADGLDGHIGGHYLSACAQLWAATGDPRIREKLDDVLAVLAECQAAAGDGYVGGVPCGRGLGEELAAGKVDADLFTLNGRWVPLYNLHKTFAGLLDAHTYAGSTHALVMLTALADWWLKISTTLDDESFEDMLRTEFGGLNDTFASLADITGRDDYLREARRFAHRAVLDPLASGRDELDGLHANTQIPKVVGYARLAAAAGDAEAARAADFFWDTVLARRTVSIGGNSVREHFHPADDFAPMVQDEQGPETCNTYNMLKLAKLRFERTGDPSAIDFYERATYNHILSSQHPDTGGFAYFTPMRPAHYRVYSKAQESMWCCVGSGLENHSRYGELIYSHGADGLAVNLYIPSELDWADHGVRIRLDTDFPRSDTATVHITADEPAEFTLRLRRPGWATRIEADAGGQRLDALPGNRDLAIHRTWTGTTKVTIRLGAEVRAEALPDGSPWVSFTYGPVVLAARQGANGVPGFEAPDERMGHVASGTKVPLANTPVVTAPKPADAVVLLDRRTLTAELTACLNGDQVSVRLEPFAGIHDERYTVYWPTGPSDGERTAELASLDARAGYAADVIDCVTAGEQQPEADHHFAGESTRAGGSGGVHWRSATGWFSYILAGTGDAPAVLRVRFRAAARQGRGEDLRLNGVPLGEPENTSLDGTVEIQNFMLAAGAPGTFTFSVHALSGTVTGDLLSVQVLRGDATL
ncbi:glycoside hydrolase family 127 protein [Pseudarthrobacter sp. BIM B-2242]|uniref:glycoside hydrolase family 127 protein n=1 Tax=Pseudarthrobacter sp. BIM B-2242 TaxID=2772401 RepID=UPI00168AFE58|nr:glycoside hydrolase family 127 protein [Pseudarthrobacter sp. BIM B-2242]QOD04783.1 glycoside hydrolase family 127 protein [Pseudarthrobacter sp. BIM B-2242]